MTTKIKNIVLAPLNILYKLSPALTLKILFAIKNGYRLNLKNPKTYNEKLQWVKVNFKHPLLTKLVDKYTVREYVMAKAPELLTKVYWSGFDAKEIPWDDLPNKFVIKVTHGSGFNIICKDKNKINKNECIFKLNNWLKEKFLRCYGEWFYGVEEPRILIEEFLDAGDGKVPEDYKIFCFDGEPRFIAVDTDRFTNHKRNIYDLEWNFMKGVTLNFPNDNPLQVPEKLEELITYAKLLSQGFPHVRVDLYIVKDKVYFGEMTFTNGAGFDKIKPKEFDEKLGELFKLGEYHDASFNH